MKCRIKICDNFQVYLKILLLEITIQLDIFDDKRQEKVSELKHIIDTRQQSELYNFIQKQYSGYNNTQIHSHVEYRI